MIKNYLQSSKYSNNDNNIAKEYQNLMFIQIIKIFNIYDNKGFQLTTDLMNGILKSI